MLKRQQAFSCKGKKAKSYFGLHLSPLVLKLAYETSFLLLHFLISLCRYKPDVIKGDMDSVRPEVKEYYSNMVNCSIYLQPLIQN